LIESLQFTLSESILIGFYLLVKLMTLHWHIVIYNSVNDITPVLTADDIAL